MLDKCIDWWDRYKLWRYSGYLKLGGMFVCGVVLFVGLNWWYGEKTGTARPQVVAPLSSVPTQTALADAPIRQSERVFAKQMALLRQKDAIIKKQDAVIAAINAELEKQRVQFELWKHEKANPVDLKAEREVERYAKDVLGELGLRSVTVVNR